jgi:SNF2 family DNA or RNA helicase/predicted RNA methylase
MKKNKLTSTTLGAIASTPDAAQKGTQQYLTPYDYAEALSIPLTYTRPVIADLHCGDGSLVSAAANDTTQHLLGHDIDPAARIPIHPLYPKLKRSHLHHDITETFNHLHDTQTKFDLLTLNPPFSLRWNLDDLPSIKGNLKGNYIDSTHATIRMANDLMTDRGEALIIVSTNAFKRLLKEYPTIFNKAWLAVTMPSFFPGVSKKLSVTAIYLAGWNTAAPAQLDISPPTADKLTDYLVIARRKFRPRHVGLTDVMQRWPDTMRAFNAVTEEIKRVHHNAKSVPNITLDANGNIHTRVTSYQNRSIAISADEVNAIRKLNGTHPYQVVLQKNSRVALGKLLNAGIWTICPIAKQVINKSIASYSLGRVSLTPLSTTQCLGWIDEEDSILCTKDFKGFKAGSKYPIETTTVEFMKTEKRPCIVRGRRTTEEVEVNGNDLKITIGEKKDAASFMHIPDRSGKIKQVFDLEALETHFHIPTVPDVAQANPTLYKKHRKKLETMLRAPWSFKNFQAEDIARAACVDGCIFGHVQGLGKSLAAFAFPNLKNAKRSLIVAPGGLLKQFRETAAEFYGQALPVIRTIDDLKKWKLHLPPNPNAKTQHFIITYEALTKNGGDEWQPEKDSVGEPIIKSNDKKRIIGYKAWATQNAIARLTGKKYDPSESFTSIGKEINGITCLWKPSIASMLAIYEGQGAGIDCIVLDEATRLQSTTSKMACGIRKLNPAYRLLLTGTPIKNKVDSIFHLLHYAAGGHASPTSQFPFTADAESKERFANLYLEKDRFVSREEAKKYEAQQQRKKIPKGKILKLSSRICNIHHLWKLIAPTIIRRRKDNCGEDIVERTIRPIIVKPGTAQLAVYGHHLDFPPVSPKGNPTKAIHGRAAIGYQINILRQVALCPDNPDLNDIINSSHKDLKRSWTPWTPKHSATLSLVAKLLSQGEQVVIGSPFTHFNETIHRFLVEAGVPSLLLDGQTSPAKRGLLVNQFKNKVTPVIVAGVKAMGEGYSLECCSHLILPSLSWAYDENDQFIDRVWRLNSKKPVTIYPIITECTIDELMHSSYADKKDSAQLALDAKVLPDQVEDINPEILLADAYDKFRSNSDSIPEETLEDGWPQLSKSLRISSRLYKEFHPPIVSHQVTAEEITNARNALNTTPEQDFAIAQARNKAKILKQMKEMKQQKRRK